MSMANTPHNPLADVVYDELTPILDAIYKATESIELEGSRSGGVQIVDGEDREYRPSTDDECFSVEFSIITQKCTFDARRPLFRQLSNWLKQLADDIDEARASLERIEGIRDTVVIPRKQRSA